MHIESFFDPATSTFSYLLLDPQSRRCALIDSVLDYDFKAGRTATLGADRLIERVRALGATVDWILETHVHADHLSAAVHLKSQLGGRTGIGDQVPVVQRFFAGLFNEGAGFAIDGRQFDHLFADGEVFHVGALRCEVLHTPGHTPACVAYRVNDGETEAVFVGDTIFMPDAGSARCDFPGGDPHALYRSVRRLLSLPAATRLYLCHDYPPVERPVEGVTTVGDERERNIHLRDGIAEADFVRMREARDATLAMPVLLLPSVQVNMRAGALPDAEANGIHYLKIPLNAL